jgi:hypothetical protein
LKCTAPKLTIEQTIASVVAHNRAKGGLPLGQNALTAGAGEGNRTLDIQLGKLSFYH